MAQVIENTGHTDMIHDAQMDYYGRRLATCSSDRTIRISEVDGETHKLLATLEGHEGAVWCVAWAHPKYGNILASSSYDGKVIIWREQGGQWLKVIDFASHTASVNGIAWSPHESGCLLACASSDGNVSVHEFKDNSQWEPKIFPAHGLGVNAVSWAPATVPGALASGNPETSRRGPLRRLVSGGSDNKVKIWDWDATSQTYNQLVELTGHTDWVRDVAWSPTPTPRTYIATASQDKSVRIWTTTDPGSADPGAWQCTKLDFDATCWRVSWSLSGNVLAVSCQNNKVTVWRESLKSGWQCIKEMDE